ncbi:pimeloyl-ACP methyl ester carboxylesterase [Bradyrhizobium sp. AZCC 1588]
MIADRADQPFDEIWLKVSGLRVHCLKAGATGPAVLLLHGSAFDAAGVSFASAISALATGCRVFAPDLPGFGDSDPMPGGWGFADYSAFLSPLMAELGLQRASLAGVSMGGGIALGFALEAPERVERLVLIDSACLDDALPGGRATWFGVHVPGLSALQWRILASNRRLTGWALRRATPHRPEQVTPMLLDRVMRLLRKPGAAAALRDWERREVGWRGLRTSYVDRLPALTVSTLILHGADDPLLPVAIAERAHRLIPNARLEVIPDCGHLAPLDQPAAVSRALSEFLLPA